jgi:Spy/CpxP family protein refolding chaperone
MKIASNVWTITMAAALLAAAAAGSMAQEAPVMAAADMTNAVVPSRAQAREKRLEQMTAALGLSSNQQSRIRAILEEQEAELGRQQENVKAQQAALSAAVKSGDAASQEKIRREMSEVSSRQIEVYRKYSQSILEVMTPEQRQESQVFGVYQSLITGRLRGCDISEDQKAKIRELCKQAVSALSPTNAQARVDYAKLNAEVETQILTQEQRDQVLVQPVYSRVRRELRGCSLTPEQQTRVQAICLEAAKAAKAAPAAAGAQRSSTAVAAGRDALEKVRTTVLTDAQRLDLEVNRLYESLINAFHGCSLDPEQNAKVRAMCREAAEGFVGSPDVNARNTARRDVMEKVKASVLTDEQRAKLPPPKAAVQVLPVGGVTNEAAHP